MKIYGKVIVCCKPFHLGHTLMANLRDDGDDFVKRANAVLIFVTFFIE